MKGSQGDGSAILGAILLSMAKASPKKGQTLTPKLYFLGIYDGRWSDKWIKILIMRKMC